MKTFKSIISGIIGFASIISLWIVGGASHQYTHSSFDIDLDSIYHVLPTIVIFAIPVFLLIYSFISKKLNLKSLYFSALAGVCFPLLAYIFSCVFSNDGNILSWIYAFTIGMIFHPFHWLAWSTFNGVWFGDFGFSPELCAGILVVAIILSFILYKKIKLKKTTKGVAFMKEKENQLIENFKTFLAVPYAYFAALSVLGVLILIFEILMDTSFYNMFEGIREIVIFLFSMLQMVGIINVVWLAVAVIWCIVICHKEKNKEIFFKPYVAIALILMTVFIIITFSLPW